MAYLEFHGIEKSFPGVRALEDVSFGVGKGTCHALMGENGAGKSTLGKILAGVQTADGGRMVLDGREIAPRNPMEAREAGIAMVHQELAFCPNLSVAENLCLGALPSAMGWLGRRRMRERAVSMLREVGADLDPDAPVGALSTGHEQLVQIAAAVGTGARVIVMDEPTSSLSVSEGENLFRLVGSLKERGITVLYVSHRMEEIFRLCDAITVLRDGRHVATQAARDVGAGGLVRQMVGRDVTFLQPGHVARDLGEEVLRVRGLCSPGKFRDVSFSLRRGEIVGMAGLVGAGRSEVATALFGLDPHATGEVAVHGRPLRLGRPWEAMAAGMGLLPEDRKRQGLVLAMNCRENTSLAVLDRMARAGFVDGRRERGLAGGYIRRLNVRTPGMESGVAGLSGGNQQKIALAKWLARDCSVLIVDEPTRGVDVGAKAEIHGLLDELACRGLAILLISSELPEVMKLGRRVLVMRGGRIVAEVPREGLGAGHLMRCMAGVEGHRGDEAG